MPVEAVFLPVDPGQRLCLIHVPAGPVRGVVVHVAAFAEEMNKSRRQVSLTARAMAAAGYAVVIPDLFGCGDSSGDFGDAGWDVWLRDVAKVCGWAEQRFGRPLWLWGLRVGALLAVQSVGAVPDCNLLLWQPVVSGKLYLTQFLRLKVANEALADAASRAGTKEIHGRLMAGGSEEIAGYLLSSGLACGLDAAELILPKNFPGKVLWLEVGASDQPQLGPRSQSVISSWAAMGVRVEGHAMGGPSFWQTVETSECPALAEVTVAMLETSS
jgi:uncharacterized protein